MSSMHRSEREAHAQASEPLLRPSPDAFKHVGAEIRLGEHYAASHGGLLPTDQFWSYEEYRHDLNPRGFDQHHARLAPLLDRNEAVRHESAILHPEGGTLPDTPYWDYLRFRHDLDPKRFDHYHHRLGKLLDRDETYRESHLGGNQGRLVPAPAFYGTVTIKSITSTPDKDPAANPAAVTPEPAAVFLMTVGLVVLFMGRMWTRERRSRTGYRIAAGR